MVQNAYDIDRIVFQVVIDLVTAECETSNRWPDSNGDRTERGKFGETPASVKQSVMILVGYGQTETVHTETVNLFDIGAGRRAISKFSHLAGDILL